MSRQKATKHDTTIIDSAENIYAFPSLDLMALMDVADVADVVDVAGYKHWQSHIYYHADINTYAHAHLRAYANIHELLSY